MTSAETTHALRVAVDDVVGRVLSNPASGRRAPENERLAEEVDGLARIAHHDSDRRRASELTAAARTVSWLLRAPVGAAMPSLAAPNGMVTAVWRAGGARRALILGGLAQLRAALDAVPASCAPARGAPPVPGPGATASTWPLAPADAALVAAVARTGVPGIAARALALARAAVDAGSEHRDPTRNPLADIEHALLVAAVHEDLPGTVLAEAAVQLIVALDAVRVAGGSNRRRLVGHEAAIAAADRLVAATGALLKLPADPLEAAEAVGSLLRGAPAPSPGLSAVAASLRGSSFLRLADERPSRLETAERTAAEAERASNDVPWLDRLNVFVRTDAEADAEHREGDAVEARRALVASDVEMRRQLVAASGSFPPLGAYLEADAVRTLVQCLSTRAEPMTQRSEDAIAARTRLAYWAIEVDRTWTPLVPALDLLERYATIELATRATFPHVR